MKMTSPPTAPVLSITGLRQVLRAAIIKLHRFLVGAEGAIAVVGPSTTSQGDALKPAHEGRPVELDVHQQDRVCRVGPGNFTPSLSQIRT